MIGGIAEQLAADRFAHCAAGAVAADDVARLDRLYLALVLGIEPFEPRRHGMVGGTRGRIDLKVEQAPAVMGLEAGGRFGPGGGKNRMKWRLVEEEGGEIPQTGPGGPHPARRGHNVLD